MSGNYPEYDECYKHIDTEAGTFKELPGIVQKDLSVWYNITQLDSEEKQLLLDLYQAGRFKAWDCPQCRDRVFRGEPEYWNDFAGVLYQDFTSFPGNRNKYTEEYLSALCDRCRLKG